MYGLFEKLHQHPWEKPEMLSYLKELDKKYGSTLSTDNMHHHDHHNEHH